MTVQRFTASLEAGPGGGAFVVLPPDVLSALGGGSRFRVTGTVNGAPLVSSTMPRAGGQVCVGVHKATRAAAAVAIGEVLELEIERDNRPREVSVPDDLAAALDAAQLTASFAEQSFTRRREAVESVTSAKRPETRARRIKQTVDGLRRPS
jgi:Bacteriocin-protection, YdeI or OmpD-Associated/Domain of unknown function (DUF1905)